MLTTCAKTNVVISADNKVAVHTLLLWNTPYRWNLQLQLSLLVLLILEKFDGLTWLRGAVCSMLSAENRKTVVKYLDFGFGESLKTDKVKLARIYINYILDSM